MRRLNALVLTDGILSEQRGAGSPSVDRLLATLFFLKEILLETHNILSTNIWENLLLTMCSEGFPGGSDGKASVCNAGKPGSIPGLGRSPREGNCCPLQCLENSTKNPGGL